MKKFLSAFLISTVISAGAFAADTTTPPASANPVPVQKNSTYSAQSEDFKNQMKNWDSLTKAQKIKLIEEKHTDSVNRSNAKWKAMSDDEKIQKFEQRRARWQAFKQAHPGAGAPGTAPAGANAAPANSAAFKK